MAAVFDPSKLNRRVRIERPVADDSLDGAGSGNWVLVKEVWAEVQDALPSRGEKLADGINVAARPARVRIRFRDDVASNMRLVLLRKKVPERIMQIVSGPATLGNRDGLEMMAEEQQPTGNLA